MTHARDRWGFSLPLFGAALALLFSMSPTLANAWTPLPVRDDPLLRMPGSQPAAFNAAGVPLEGSGRCLNCHDGYAPEVDPGFHWEGSMMAQAARDPLFWAAVAVAAQDSIWAIGRPNATDLCLRCHTPPGWLAERSDPTNGAALAGDDFDGVSCDSCHRMFDPFFEETHAGLREGSDWVGYWDEASALSSSAALATLSADRLESSSLLFFDGSPFYGVDARPISADWLEAGGGQYFMSTAADKRASFADDVARHGSLYSRFHKSRYFCQTCHDVSNAVLQNLGPATTLPGGEVVLPAELSSASSYFHVERTFSEFLLSDFGQGPGAPGIGPFAPGVFQTSRPGELIATCQDCHMPDRVGPGCDKPDAPIRPADSLEHPASGQPLHDLTGGNAWIPWLLASTVATAANYDPVNEALLAAGPATLTMDLGAGLGLNADALLAGVGRSVANLQRAAAIESAAYESVSGRSCFGSRTRRDTSSSAASPRGGACSSPSGSTTQRGRSCMR